MWKIFSFAYFKHISDVYTCFLDEKCTGFQRLHCLFGGDKNTTMKKFDKKDSLLLIHVSLSGVGV